MKTRDPLAGFDAPHAPDGLRERVLSAARRAVQEPAQRRSFVDALWESRLLWWTWAGTLAALLTVYFWLGRSLSPIDAGTPDEADLTMTAEMGAGTGIIGTGPSGEERLRARLASIWATSEREGLPE